MLKNFYIDNKRKQSANKKDAYSEFINKLSFSDFLKLEIKSGAQRFDDLSSVSQNLMVKKYFLSMDDLDSSDMFCQVVEGKLNDQLITQVKKLFKSEISGNTFKKWLKQTVLEECRNKVDALIQDEADKFSAIEKHDDHDRQVDEQVFIYKQPK